MSRTPVERERRGVGEAGFTLLEVLAAVAILGFAISAIGSVVAVTMAGVRSAADRVALAETGRTLLDGLPRGDDLKPGTTAGLLGTTRWRIDVTPLAVIVPVVAPAAAPAAPPGAPPPSQHTSDDDAPPPGWRPAAIVISATTRAGRRLRLDTVGLLRRTAP